MKYIILKNNLERYQCNSDSQAIWPMGLMFKYKTKLHIYCCQNLLIKNEVCFFYCYLTVFVTVSLDSEEYLKYCLSIKKWVPKSLFPTKTLVAFYHKIFTLKLDLRKHSYTYVLNTVLCFAKNFFFIQKQNLFYYETSITEFNAYLFNCKR